MTTIREHYELPANGYTAPGDKQFFAGIEYEIESIKDYGDIGAEGIFTRENDHSLRNNGFEFKTIPMPFEKHLEAFKRLHKRLTLGKDPFSERTSIHVHVNVREFEINQVRQLVLSYALVEPLFFSFVGDLRKNSIFCVPLNYTYLPSLYKLSTPQLVEKWHKYTAFNILPITSFGTVEFRHMYGTDDFEKFKEWLSALKELYSFINDNPTFNLINSLEEMKGEGLSTLALAMVPTFAVKHSRKTLETMLEDSLLDVKLSVGGLK